MVLTKRTVFPIKIRKNKYYNIIKMRIYIICTDKIWKAEDKPLHEKVADTTYN